MSNFEYAVAKDHLVPLSSEMEAVGVRLVRAFRTCRARFPMVMVTLTRELRPFRLDDEAPLPTLLALMIYVGGRMRR